MSSDSNEWIGSVLCDGRYEVLNKLGEGGMSIVYLARDKRLATDVVVKVPRRAIQEDPQFSGRFQREVRSLVTLSHPHICKVLDVGELAGRPFAVMQFLGHGDVDARRTNDAMGEFEPMKAEDVLSWIGKIAEALDFVHKRGFVHRDVKPSNIMFDENDHPYLADFGVVKVIADEHSSMMQSGATGTGMVVGTPDYMAPELIMGNECDGRTDQYALAVTVFELLAGRPPFHGASGAVMVQQTTKQPPKVSDLNDSLPEQVNDVLNKALSKEPDARYKTCAEFANALAEAVAPQTTQPTAENQRSSASTVAVKKGGATEIQKSPAASKTGLFAGIGVVALLLLVAAGIAGFAFFGPDDSINDDGVVVTDSDEEDGVESPSAIADRFAVVELSTAGVRAVVVPVKDESPTILDRRFRSLNLGEIGDASQTSFLIERTISAMKEHLEWLAEDPQLVPRKNVFVAIKSDVAEGDGLSDLIAQIKDEFSLPVQQISLTDEVTLLIEGVVPSAKLNTSAVVDVGGDAIRCGYRIVGSGALVTSNEVVLTPVPGPLTFYREAQKKSLAEGVTLPESSKELRLEKVVLPLRARIRAGLRNRQEIFLSGDIAWALVTLLHPELADRPEVDLPYQEMEQFREQLLTQGDDIFSPSATLSEQAQQDIARIRDTFSVDELISGADVLIGVSLAFRLNEEGRTIHFSRRGSRAWLIGFALDKANPKS